MFNKVGEILKQELGDTDFGLSPSDIEGRGHISTNAPFIFSKKKGVSTLQAAGALERYLKNNSPKGFLEKIEISGNGFLNIWFSQKTIQNEFQKIAKAGKEWGAPDHKTKEKIIVEYSQPNIAKPMHIGHVRSTIIGDALANILEFSGKKIIRWNYLGDWGTQFGKVITAYKKWGDNKKIDADPVNELNNLYVKFHEEAEHDPKLEDEARAEFKKLEDGDRENTKLWKRFKKESIKEFEGAYEILGVHFDEWKGESFYRKDLGPLIKKLEDSGIAKESEGALVVDFGDRGLPPGLIRKSDGATLYLTRDIANLEYRIKKYKPNTILYLVDNGQSLHFEQLSAVAEKIGLKTNIHHVKFGLVLSGDMKKLSTRAGRHIALMDVINEAIKRARAVVDEKQPELSDKERIKISRVIGIGALKYNDLSQNRQSDIAFNWDKMLSIEGNSGPYIQYTYARLKSILRKAKRVPKFDENLLKNENDQKIVLKLAEFPGIIEKITKNYYPHYLAEYLYDLSKTVNSFYEKEPVLKAEDDLRKLRLNLINSCAETIKTGLSLLGIGAVERM
jgi:arginyl-tRNA synthetase